MFASHPFISTPSLEEMVKGICQLVSPKKIILFGSRARGKENQESDYDFLIIVGSGTHCRQAAMLLYRNLVDRPAADFLVVDEDIIRSRGDEPGSVYREALREGKELYAA